MAGLESNLALIEIQRISTRKLAVEDRLYKDEDGLRYIGLADGRLQVIPTIKGDVVGDLEASVVSTVGGKTSKEISDAVDQTDTNTSDIATKIDRCESIALTIALG